MAQNLKSEWKSPKQQAKEGANYWRLQKWQKEQLEKKYAGIPEELRGAEPIPESLVRSLPEEPEEVEVDRKKFIEEQFMIRSLDGKIVPFKLNKVQEKYYKLLLEDKPNNLRGVREIILKARQQGFSSFVLALFAVDFITKPNTVSVCISYRADETKRLFKRVRFYIESYCTKNNFNITDYLSIDTKQELENATNSSYFYIGTAGAKVGGRGQTITNLHFSEAAFFEETEKITAQEIIEATSQQVPQGSGMIFVESTGGHYGSYYQGEWERAKKRENNYAPRFFSWKEFYSPEYMEKKKKDFSNEYSYKSHYPADDVEAFIYSGRPFFDRATLEALARQTINPIEEGRLAPDGNFI